MKKLINESEAVGKVVEEVVTHCGLIAIIFADDTALVRQYDNDYDEMMSADPYNSYAKRELGLITEEEYESEEKAKKRLSAEVVKTRELSQLKRLQYKYPEA